jgi:hypothetical protein
MNTVEQISNNRWSSKEKMVERAKDGGVGGGQWWSIWWSSLGSRLPYKTLVPAGAFLGSLGGEFGDHSVENLEARFQWRWNSSTGSNPGS